MSRLNTTEQIIRSLVDNGNSITFSPSDYGKMVVSIDEEQPKLVACDFVQMHELFLGHYLTLGIESEKRIDGGCNSPWHILTDADKEKECPICQESVSEVISCTGCQQEITAENAGGYRTFCEECVSKFPEFPNDGKGYTIEVGQFGDFKWVNESTEIKNCKGGWHDVPIHQQEEMVSCNVCGEKYDD